MALLPAYRGDLPRVQRFSLVARVAHWGHALTFFLCFASGMAIFFRSSLLAMPFGGLAGASLVHKVSAVALTALILLYVVLGFRSLLRWWWEILRFGRRDAAFLAGFPKKFLGIPVSLPPQTKLNGGEKINSIVTSAAVLALIGSGLVIWFPDRFSVATVQWSYLVHAVAMIIATTLALAHAYLGSLHPETNESFWGMVRGTVRADWAEKHHRLWLEEMGEACRSGERGQPSEPADFTLRRSREPAASPGPRG